MGFKRKLYPLVVKPTQLGLGMVVGDRLKGRVR